MYRILNKLSECIHFYISKNIASYTFLLVFKIVKNFPCILKADLIERHILNIYTQAAAYTKTDKYVFKIKFDEKFFNLYQHIDLSNSDEIIKLPAEKPRRSLQQHLAKLFNFTVVLSK